MRLLLLLLVCASSIGHAQNFIPSKLLGFTTNSPTSLQFGPDGRLYVANVDGDIYALTVERNAAGNYVALSEEYIGLIRSIKNHKDDGTVDFSQTNRQVTGILLGGTSANPIVYVTSSDPRIGGGGSGSDINLDTNSGVISKVEWNGSSWTKVDLVRGLARSEENHATNGLTFNATKDKLYVAAGGHTNAGAPSNNFAFLTEYALSACILEIDLNMLDAMPVLTDPDGTAFIYDLPTLDDPTRPNVSGADVNDPFGGNDGLNQAKLVPGGPVQIFASGFRNPYDLVLTESGRLYTWDNGANSGWGGHPKNEGSAAVTNDYVPGEPGSTGPGPNDGVVNNQDGLHLVSGAGYYGGHPCPVRANPATAGLYTSAPGNTLWRNSITADPNTSLPVDWPPVPVALADPTQSDFQNPGEDDLSIFTQGISTNGITEYTASTFDGSLKGDLLAVDFAGAIKRVKLNSSGTINSNADVTDLASGFSAVPLDITSQGDGDVFPGTIWVASLGSADVTVFEPLESNFYNPFFDHVAINCGASSLLFEGQEFIADTFFTGGSISNTAAPIAGATAGPFHSERWASNLQYSFPTGNGRFEITLYLAEIYGPGFYSGFRVFDVFAEDSLLLNDLDIFDSVGALSPLKITFTVEVNDGILNLSSFASANNAKYSAIEIKRFPAFDAFAVNCGGPAIFYDDFQFQADSFYTYGNTVSTSTPIAGSTNSVFNSLRSGFNFLYNFPTGDGTFDVTLYFAEIAGSASVGSRLIDVYLEGSRVVDDLDIYHEVGSYAPLTYSFQTTVDDSILSLWAIASVNAAQLSAIRFDRVCGALDSDDLDEDGDLYTNADEISNGTDPCNAAAIPADFDGSFIGDFKVSDKNDPDDDDDGLLDFEDFFVLDPSNGLSTYLPIDYPMLNVNPGTGFFGLGFTGLMVNYADDYLDLINDENNSTTELIAGGAVGLFTQNHVAAGSQYKALNSLKNGFQFGVNVDSNSAPFIVEADMLGPLYSSAPDGFQSAGVYVGNGDQENYFALFVFANNGSPTLALMAEFDGISKYKKIPLTGIGDSLYFTLGLKVDPTAATVQPAIRFPTQSNFQNLFAKLPVLGELRTALLNDDQALAVGVYASTYNSDPAFSATWDNIRINEDLSVFSRETIGTIEMVSFPNPMSEELSICTEEGILEITVFDLSGRTVLTQKSANSRTCLNISVANLPKGSYLLEVSTQSGFAIEKLVKH